jgi:hypothetical protein
MRRAVRGFEPDAHKIVSGDMPTSDCATQGAADF